jgi:hypothetical protein
LYCTARAAVIQTYERWLRAQLRDPSSAASREIARLARLARTRDLCLVCWCAPRPCHAEVIQRVIEESNTAEEA